MSRKPANGREAIEQFRAHRPDVTLMDLQMPLMGGGEAILAIRKEFPDARIIVLTSTEVKLFQKVVNSRVGEYYRG